ncbi:hypothetical protein [Paraburkholderia sp. BL21I4N1]|uniref:hypothetical protein n=1 Tax=Paraburkholderia sp. BL21I4N1 TaxID=1938801 RepID=UPI002157A267|nr:hypothetical protein [Paraburkholderia sp. BL21I4N1]
MIELTSEQVAALADVDAKGFVERVRQALMSEEPELVNTAFLWARLWRAFNVARGIGIREDAHLIEFLRLEAYSPSFYEKPAMRAWIKRSGHSADERFHDFLCVLRWRIEHPEFVGGLTYGDDTGAAAGERRRGVWAGFVERWKGFAGWCGYGGGGKRGG